MDDLWRGYKPRPFKAESLIAAVEGLLHKMGNVRTVLSNFTRQ
jgi:hypothetical protein